MLNQQHKVTDRDAMLPRYLCEHVKDGALTAARLQQEGAMISLCRDCYAQQGDLRLTADGKIVRIG